MAAKRLILVMALAILAATAGCRHWCDNHYPCQQQCQQACQPCVPCCPPATTSGLPAVPVPVSRLDECLVGTKEDIAQSGLIAPIVGHVGDGNFHTLILIDPNSPEEIERAKALHERMVQRALSLEGTCTGEHGIGNGKIAFLEQELGDAVPLMRAIKQTLDPQGLMNPGKIFS